MHWTQAVSKRALHSSAVETGLRERPTTASASVGNGKATLQNLAIFRFDTASADHRPTTERDDRLGRGSHAKSITRPNSDTEAVES